MNLRFIAAHSWFTGAHAIKSTYPYIIASLGFPLSLLFIVGVLSSGTLLPYALVGGLVAIVASNGIACMGDLGMFKFEQMYKDLVVTTKTSPIDYMFGIVLANLLWSSPGIILFFILDILYGLLTPYSFVMTIMISVLVVISTSSIAFLLSSFVRHLRHVWSIITILTMLMTVLPPTFYPYTYLPKDILLALTISPTTPAAVLEQGIFNLGPMQWYMLAILIIETLVYFMLARYLTVWRER